MNVPVFISRVNCDSKVKYNVLFILSPIFFSFVSLNEGKLRTKLNHERHSWKINEKVANVKEFFIICVSIKFLFLSQWWLAAAVTAQLYKLLPSLSGQHIIYASMNDECIAIIALICFELSKVVV